MLTSWFVGGRRILDEKAHEDQHKQSFVLMRSASKFFTPGKEWECSVRIHPSLTACCTDDIFCFAVTP